MIISLLCDNKDSWIIPYMKEIKEELIAMNHIVYCIDSYKYIIKGDLAFILGCEIIIPSSFLKLNRHNLVIHESALPSGKGWSPLTWQILEGNNKIPVTLFEAIADVDSGDIYLQDFLNLNGDELVDEIKHKQGLLSKKLVIEFVSKYPNIKGKKQHGKETYYKKRTPMDSELNINKTIVEQFNLLRVADNDRYPAFFYINEQKYIIKIFKG